MKKTRTILTISIMMSLLSTIPALAADGNWGLSFRENGKPPVGNATGEHLVQYDAAYLGDTSQKVIYLTFDAGYENGCTPAILDTLKKHNVPAAFFLVGHYIKANPELTQRICAEGHIVGNHTNHHPDMSKMVGLEDFRQELESLEDMFREATGTEMSRFYRPPQGKYSEENLKQAKQMGYKTIFWSLAYVDWLQDKQPSREKAFETLMPRIHPGAIVLLHSTSQTNAEILDELLTRWKAEGYRFGKLDELFAE